MAALNPERLDRVRAMLAGLATPVGREPLRTRLVTTTAKLVTQERNRGLDPTGYPLIPLKHGRRRTPLYGRGNIARAATVEAVGERIAITFPGIPDEILRAHQDGAVIPARRARASERMVAPKSGKFLSGARARKRKLVYVTAIPEHAVRSFTLPQRRIVPDVMPSRYADALNTTAIGYVREVSR